MNAVRVLTPAITEGQEWVRPVGEDGHEFLQGLDGTPRVSSWTPVPVKMLREDEGQTFRRVDLPWIGDHALVFRDSAMPVARDLLGSAGEFLPLGHVDRSEPVWMFNVCRVVDALDEDRSEVVRFSSGGIMMVTRYEFRAAEVEGEVAFRVPQLRTLFLTGHAAARFEDAGLSGATFRQVWGATTQDAASTPRSEAASSRRYTTPGVGPAIG